MAKKDGYRCILYHGSQFVVEHPIFGFGKVHNDYGLGFYCTESCDMAKEWAVSEEHDGYANRYELDLNGLKILDLAKAPFNTLHWLSVLVENRIFDMDGDVIESASAYLHEHFAVDYASADVIIGYRADDNYFSFARGFLNGTLSYGQLCRAIRLGGLGLQYVLKSRRAFAALRPAGCEPALRSVCLKARRNREDAARREFVEIRSKGFERNGLYMVNIMQQEIKGDDPRLSTVLS